MLSERVLVNYAKWLATSSGQSEDQLFTVVKRLGFNSFQDIDDIESIQFQQVFQILDQRKIESLDACAMYLKTSPKANDRFVKVLLWILRHALEWNVSRRVDKTLLAANWTSAIVYSCKFDATIAICDYLETFCSSLVNNSGDLEDCSKVLAGIFEGLIEGLQFIKPDFATRLLSITCDLLNSGVYDLEEFLKDIPHGSRVEEILQRHYFLLRTLLAFQEALFAHDKIAHAEPSILADLKAILLGYYRESCQFLLHATSNEQFLVETNSIIAKIICHCVASSTEQRKEVAEFVNHILQSSANLAALNSFVSLVEPSCDMLFQCASDHPQLYNDAIFTLKALVTLLSQVRSSNQTIAYVGQYIGRLLKLFILQGNVVFCESFVTNLAVELPLDCSSDNEPVFVGIIQALGSISLSVDDDSITRICLSTLIAQFKKSPKIGPELFFEQFNVIAASSAPSFLSSVLDIYIGIYMESDQPKQLEDVGRALKALVVLNSEDTLKTEILLQTVLRLFVDKGMVLVKQHLDKHARKGANMPPMAPPAELEYLLPVVEAVLINSPKHGAINKPAKLEAFQEFWLLLIFTGYQFDLSWPSSWNAYLPAIALATPVLIKEKDQLKAITAPISQVLLSQSLSNQMRSQLSSLMPNVANIKYLTFSKALWLLSVFFSESQKLKHGNLHDLMAYMTSEILVKFELESFVEDLVMTVFKRWLADGASHNQAIIDSYACELVGYCCNSQERVHGFAMRFLKMILDNYKQTYSCHALWEAFLKKILLQYEICRRELGEAIACECTTDELYGNMPENGRAAFEGLVLLARNVFAAASVEFPHDLYAFLQKSLHDQQVFFEGRPGDRDVRMLELFRLCLPMNTENVPSYLNLILEFQSKPEDYVKWLLCRSGINGKTVPDLVVSWKGSGHQSELLTLTTQAYLAAEHGRLDVLEKIVNYPFTTGEAFSFKEAVYCWAWLLDARPALEAQFLAILIEAWKSHVKSGIGAFGERAEASVFERKISTAATVITKISPQSSPSIAYVILTDFLHERLLLASRSTDERFRLFYQLVQSMLSAFSAVVAVHRMRPAILKCCILGFELMGQLRTVLPSRRLFIIRSHLYSLVIRLFEQPETFSVEDKDTLKYEEGLFLKLRNYFASEKHALSDLKGAPEKLQDAAEVIRAILTHERERLLVWNGRLTAAQNYFDTATHQGLLRSALKVSLSLAIQSFLRFSYGNMDNATLGIFATAGSQVRFTDGTSVDFFLKYGLPFPKRQLIHAPTLNIVSSIGIFRNERLAAIPLLVNYTMRSLEVIKPEALYFYIPQIVQALRHDKLGYIERTIMHVARTSSLFAHQIIWNMKANTYQDDLGTIPDPQKDLFESMIDKVSRLLAGIDKDFFEREFAFFDKVTAISGTLKPFVKREKWEKKQKIDEELAKVAVDPGVYLPSNPESIVLDIDYQSGRPLQSAAKAPFMATFKVRPASEPAATPTWQSVIFKVGDDCRQDVLALQMMTVMKNIFESIGLNLYFFPYRVVATGPGCGVIEVIPNAISRGQLGTEQLNNLFDYFVFKFGNVRSPTFARARENFIKSMAAYSLATYLLALKDRHNANIMVSDAGHIIHIDFGFILDMSPGGLGLEGNFKLTSEMMAVMGGWESPYFNWFRELTIQGFLALRSHAEHIIDLVEQMAESGLPCFKGESTLRKLRARFRLDLNDADARQYCSDIIYKACETFRTTLYDKFQEKTNGIPY